MRTDQGFNLRRSECCPGCKVTGSLIQRFADHGYDSVCLLCGYQQTWAEQVAADQWRQGARQPGPVIQIMEVYSARGAA